LLLSACIYNRQSVTNPAGPQSGRTDILWWFFFWLLGAIFVAVMIFTLLTLTRGRGITERQQLAGTHTASEQTEHRLRRTVAGCTITTILILFVLIFASVQTGKANLELAYKKNSSPSKLRERSGGGRCNT
jgi:heme/copper-type cytochrome/quinol oxidase subunit 2